MNELIKYFLQNPIDSTYIHRIAFQYFDSDYKSAELFLNSLIEENNHINEKNSSINF
tara:strand:+ start:93 stop:263 length:171 start_codon:yes stop_codon:yes gene_type:complete